MERTILRDRACLNIDKTSMQARAVSSLLGSLHAIADVTSSYEEIAKNIHENLNATDARLQITRNRLATVREQTLRVKDIVANSSFGTGSRFSRKRKAPSKFITIGKRPKHLTDVYDNLQGLPNFAKLEQFRDRLVTNQKSFSTKYSDPSIFVREKLESLQKEYAVHEGVEEEMIDEVAERYQGWLERMIEERKGSVSVPEIKRRVFFNEMGEKIERPVKTFKPESASADTQVPSTKSQCGKTKAQVSVSESTLMKDQHKPQTPSISDSDASSIISSQRELSPDIAPSDDVSPPMTAALMAPRSRVSPLDSILADIRAGGTTLTHVEIDGRYTSSIKQKPPSVPKVIAPSRPGPSMGSVFAQITSGKVELNKCPRKEKEQKKKGGKNDQMWEIRRIAEEKRQRAEEKRRKEAAAAAQNLTPPPKPTTPKMTDPGFNDLWALLDKRRQGTRPSDATSEEGGLSDDEVE